jgi:hypothetical protein
LFFLRKTDFALSSFFLRGFDVAVIVLLLVVVVVAGVAEAQGPSTTPPTPFPAIRRSRGREKGWGVASA